MGKGHEFPSGVPPPQMFWNEYALGCYLVHFEKQCYSVCTNLVASEWFFRFSYWNDNSIFFFWGGGGGEAGYYFGGRGLYYKTTGKVKTRIVEQINVCRESPQVRESKAVLDSGFHAVDFGFLLIGIFWILCQWNLDSRFQPLVGLRIPKRKIQIPQA